MERNVCEVFGERDSERRKSVINDLYTEDCTFFEADDQIIGRDALNAKVEHILKEAPGFVFRLAGPAEVNHDHGRLRWYFGPNGAAPVVTGMDVAVFKRGRICSLYAFLDKAPSD
jgi:hypothetical protein